LPGNLWRCKGSEIDEVHLVWPGPKDPDYDDGTAFLNAKIKRSTA
jgi:hypothetical protein